jgi:hypothetical protein
MSWNKSPIWGLRPDFCYCQTVAGLLMWGALSDERTGSVVYNCCCPSPSQSFSGPSPAVLVNIFYCLRFETSHFAASYDSHGYGGGIRPRLHTGFDHKSKSELLYDWRFTASQFVLAPGPLRPTTKDLFPTARP